MERLPAHPVAAIFPEMSGPPFAELVADIKQNGLREPVLLHPDGSILDGRNRYRACLEAGVEPSFRTWDGRGSLVTLVLSLNLHRRHLDGSQRAMVGARAKPLFVQEAHDRQMATLKQNARRTPQPGPMGHAFAIVPATDQPSARTVPINLTERDKGEWREKAAELVSVSPVSVFFAAKVVEHGVPELVEAVDRREVSVSAAARVAELPAEKQRALLAEGPKRACAMAAEIRKSHRRRPRPAGGKRDRKHPNAGQIQDPTHEGLLCSRLIELMAHYELVADRRVAGLEIQRSEPGTITGIRIVHEREVAAA